MLLSTQADILPHLVLTKRKDILEQIATARGSSIQDVCIQPRKHLANILALLLCQPVADVEQSTMDALVSVSPAFGESGYGLSDYVKYEPVMVACEILKSAADQNESKKPQVSYVPLNSDHTAK
jgi:serine/threonine-protein kinase ATR